MAEVLAQPALLQRALAVLSACVSDEAGLQARGWEAQAVACGVITSVCPFMCVSVCVSVCVYVSVYVHVNETVPQAAH
jgi:uncharacterized protein (DUF2062 family)